MDYTYLLNTPVFRGLDIAEIMSLISSTPYRIRRFNAGAMIFQSGEPVNSFVMVISGSVKGEMTDYSGRVLKIEEIREAGSLGAAFLFAGKSVFPVNVIAVTDTELLTIEKNDFLRFLKWDDRILANFLGMISNRSAFLSEKIKFLNFKTIKGKLAQYFLQISGPGGSTVMLTMTQADLADYFGVARPSIARVVSEMENEGIIKTRGRSLRILDRERLAILTRE
jgi:CRP-like cAMP-binding protein